jgi:hypothetical protein
MSNIDDWAWKIIRACGLSTANSDINVFKLHEYITKMIDTPHFKEFPIGNFVMRFYKTDHVWTCTVTEDMLDEAIKIAKPLSEEYIQSEWERLGKKRVRNDSK